VLEAGNQNENSKNFALAYEVASLISSILSLREKSQSLVSKICPIIGIKVLDN
jgi:hypothetical protein